MSYTPGPLPAPQKQVYCSHPDKIGNTWTAWQTAAADYFTPEQVAAHVAAEVAQAVADERERCGYCDGTGDVTGFDGEWRGYCSCEAGQLLKSGGLQGNGG